MDYSKMITEVYEKEQPELVKAIKQAVDNNESRSGFHSLVKGMFPDYKTSLTAQACMTIFDYYKRIK